MGTYVWKLYIHAVDQFLFIDIHYQIIDCERTLVDFCFGTFNYESLVLGLIW